MLTTPRTGFLVNQVWTAFDLSLTNCLFPVSVRSRKCFAVKQLVDENNRKSAAAEWHKASYYDVILCASFFLSECFVN